MKRILRTFVGIVACSFLVTFLASCGGGGGGGIVASPVAISGTAATGAPITNAMNAVVTLKDSSAVAQLAITTTDAMGTYSFTQDQIKGFTAPFMIQVSYRIGGVNFYLHSAVTAQDVTSGNATINITPFTDVVIGNLAGQVAQNVFNNGNFASLLTPAALSAGVQALDVLLQPVLTQLGLSATLDLLHQSFNANGSGLDALLDSVHVSVDPTTRSQTFTNTRNGTSVSGTLGALPPTPLSTTGSASLTDLQAVNALFANFASVMATNPTATTPALLALFDQPNFIDNGKALPTFLQQIVNNPGIAGATLSFSNIALESTPAIFASMVPTSATASYKVGFTILQNNKATGRLDFIVYKSAGGSWLVLGNLFKAKIDFSAFEGNNNGIMCTGLLLNITDKGAFSSPISYATVTGPGLPTGGVMLFQGGSSNGNSFTLAAPGAVFNGTATTPATINCSYNSVYAMTDTAIANITSLPAQYVVVLHNVTGQTDTILATYQPKVFSAPLTQAQLVSSIFPTNIVSSASLRNAAVGGSTVTISWTAPAAAFEYANALNVFISSNSGGSNLNFDLTPSQTSQLVTPQVTVSPNGAGATVEYVDSAFRTIWASPGQL